MRVLDVFAGTGSATKAFKDAGHEVRHVELFPGLMKTPDPVVASDVWEIAADPEKFLGAWKPHFVWLSPPCQSFSLGGNRNKWVHGKERDPPTTYPFFGPRMPRTRGAWDACGLVLASFLLLEALGPVSWVMENPRGGLRTMGFMTDKEPVTTTYCQYGDTRMKPTDFWCDSPETLASILKPACKNGSPCHVAAPRGADTGTQGLKDARLRGMIPEALSMDFLRYAEARVGWA